MSLDLILRYWNYIESDFAREYGVHQPLRLTWRKFLAYVMGLPPESAWARATHEERKLETMSATERMDYYRAKHEDRPVTAEALEEMAKGN